MEMDDGTTTSSECSVESDATFWELSTYVMSYLSTLEICKVWVSIHLKKKILSMNNDSFLSPGGWSCFQRTCAPFLKYSSSSSMLDTPASHHLQLLITNENRLIH